MTQIDETGDPSALSLAAIRRLQVLTIAWMCVELAVAVATGIRAHSAALTAFGADSAIELLSAFVVLRRFEMGPSAERTSSRIGEALLYTLAVYIVLSTIATLFIERIKPKPSIPGILLLFAAGIAMPLLGRAKRRLAAETRSGALRADATQTSVCAYMSWIALTGLAVNAMFHLAWADSIAALLLVPLVVKEALETRRGDQCSCF